MDIDRPGKQYPDGVFIFDQPVMVRYKGEIINAVAYTRECVCGPCVYVEPWPQKGGYRDFAIKPWALNEVGSEFNQ